MMDMFLSYRTPRRVCRAIGRSQHSDGRSGANADNGYFRGSADKRRSVMKLLNAEQWSKWQNPWANEKRAAELIEQSLALCTALTPRIGYDAAAAIAHKAYETGRTVRQVAREETNLSQEELARILDPWSQTERGIAK